MSTSGYLAKYFDGLPPTNGWTVGADESVARTIPTVLDQPQTDELGDVPTRGRIRSQYVVQCHEEDIPISPAHGVRTTRYVGDNEVATAPNHHTPRPDD